MGFRSLFIACIVSFFVFFASYTPIGAQVRVEALVPDTAAEMRGYGIPGSMVYVRSLDGTTIGTTLIDERGYWGVFVGSLSVGTYTYKIHATDPSGSSSPVYTRSFVVKQNETALQANIFFPPTVSVESSNIPEAGVLKINGRTAPETTVTFFLASREDTPLATVTSDRDGYFKREITLDRRLSPDTYLLQARSAAHEITSVDVGQVTFYIYSTGLSHSRFTCPLAFDRLCLYENPRAKGMIDLPRYLALFTDVTAGKLTTTIADINGDGVTDGVDMALILRQVGLASAAPDAGRSADLQTIAAPEGVADDSAIWLSVIGHTVLGLMTIETSQVSSAGLLLGAIIALIVGWLFLYTSIHRRYIKARKTLHIAVQMLPYLFAAVLIIVATLSYIGIRTLIPRSMSGSRSIVDHTGSTTVGDITQMTLHLDQPSASVNVAEVVISYDPDLFEVTLTTSTNPADIIMVYPRTNNDMKELKIYLGSYHRPLPPELDFRVRSLAVGKGGITVIPTQSRYILSDAYASVITPRTNKVDIETHPLQYPPEEY